MAFSTTAAPVWSMSMESMAMTFKVKPEMPGFSKDFIKKYSFLRF